MSDEETPTLPNEDREYDLYELGQMANLKHGSTVFVKATFDTRFNEKFVFTVPGIGQVIWTDWRDRVFAEVGTPDQPW